MTVFRVGVSMGIFIGSLSIGWWLGRRGILTKSRASKLIQILIKCVTPFVLFLSLWRVEFWGGRLWLLPIIGMAISVSMLLPAWVYARATGFTQPRTGSMLTCAFFSNLGYIGAFTAFAMFGEEAYGLCMLYLAYFTPFFYTLGFQVARRYGHRADLDIPQPVLIDELRLYPFIGMLAGLSFNLLGVSRPSSLGVANNILIPIDVALYLIAIGSQIVFRMRMRWIGASIAMSGIKFIYAPAVAWVLVNLFDLEGLPRFIVLLQASTPVAVSSLMFPLLFGLDRELSNALWLVTTILAIPWLLFAIPYLQRI